MVSHDASASAVGYLYQVRWALLEMLRKAGSRPELSMTLEKFDDVSWQNNLGDPVDALQLKHHAVGTGSLTDMSDDLWRTLKVWIDDPVLRGHGGPDLSIVTTAIAPTGTAASMLRCTERNVTSALKAIDQAALKSTNQSTKDARTAWLNLKEADRLDIIERTTIYDAEVRIEGLDAAIERELWSVAPKGREQEFRSELDAWWLSVSIDLLRKSRTLIRAGEVKAKIDDIRDRFLPDNLLTFDTNITDEEAFKKHEHRDFMKQLGFINASPPALRRAVMDFHRAVTQTTEWLERDLIEMTEFNNFKKRLTDEWEIAFDDMVTDLPADAAPEEKVREGMLLYRKLRDSIRVQLRPRYTEEFYARGIRLEIADSGSCGWHPDFEELIQGLTLGTMENSK